ncbi:MAG: aromatic hydrocarbon degradation protein [Bacteroidales bacterium]|nr:aromatic hydrocarbon degradation protein [Bacteroidales bacterium]
MKRLTLAALGVAVALGAAAEGYQVNTLSTKQLGMAHTGAALHLDAESMYFNPAGLGFMDRTLDLSASFTPIMATAKATVDGQTYTTDNTASTPLMASAAFSINRNIKAGITFYTPYGSSINWTDNWPGAVLSQNVSLKVYTVQPTVAWRVLPNLSVGAGLTISWGSVDLNKGLVSASTLDRLTTALGMGAPFGDTTPASLNLNGSAGLRCGINVGAMWDVTRTVTVGASFRSQVDMKVKAGDASLTYANEVARQLLGETLDVLDHANFRAEMPAPWVLSLGASWKPVKGLTLALDGRLTGWNAYKSLDVEFLSEQLTPYNQHLPKNYSNAWAVALGAQYAATSRLDVRAGVMVDTTPVNSDHYNPETPGMTKIEPAVGLSFRPIPQLSVDVAFMYVAGCGKDNASVTYTDLLAASMPQLGLPAEATFTADYKAHAIIPSIGVSFSF